MPRTKVHRNNAQKITGAQFLTGSARPAAQWHGVFVPNLFVTLTSGSFQVMYHDIHFNIDCLAMTITVHGIRDSESTAV
jgi:hypothetical protein